MKRIATLSLVALVALAVAVPGLAEKDRVWRDVDEKVIVIDGDQQIRFFGDEEGAYLGITLAELDEETAEAAGLKRSDGALVRSVFEDTPADEAGLEAGDVIVEFAGEKVTDVAGLIELVHGREAGDEVKVKARRDGDSKTFKVTLGERERGFTLFDGDDDDLHFEFFGGDGHRSLAAGLPWTLHAGGQGRLGVEVRDLEGDLAEYFPGADEGALVLGVNEDSAAEKAGLKTGDVIVSLGDEKVASVEDLLEAVGEAAGEGEMEIVYFRKGKRASAQVEIEEGRMAMSFDRLHRSLDKGDHKIRTFFHELEDQDWEEKLEQMEERLQELEERLEKKLNKG